MWIKFLKRNIKQEKKTKITRGAGSDRVILLNTVIKKVSLRR